VSQSTASHELEVIISKVTVIALVFAGAVAIVEAPGRSTLVETLIGITMIVILLAFYKPVDEKWYENIAFSATFSLALLITLGILIDLVYYGYLQSRGWSRDVPFFLFWLAISILSYLVRWQRRSILSFFRGKKKGHP
jgi:hypothetical protein